MFREHPSHGECQGSSSLEALPAKVRERLEQSWAGTFYREYFCRIDEAAFAVLYAETPSRPNIPVNVLVGLESLKAGFGWSDEELYEAFLYNVQVRYALGYQDLGVGQFELRTLYNFRRRLKEYQQAQGINLLEQAFAAISDEQRRALRVHSHQLRMDSTQIASNIVDASRLQLLVAGVQRLYRLLSEPERVRYGLLCGPYCQGEAEHYVYPIRGQAATAAAIEQVGGVLAHLLDELAVAYASDPVYQTVQRLFADNFQRHGDQVQAKANAEIGSGVLQSLDDVDATFRRKAQQPYKGYVANVTETCDPDNELQLIVAVQVAPNNVDDADLLVDALPALAERTAVETLYTDGAFGSPAADVALQQHQVAQLQSGIRGKAPDPDKLSLADFVIVQDAQGQPTQLTCPAGQQVAVEPGRSTGFLARFDPAICQDCPLHLADRCRAQPQQRDPRFTLSFTQPEVFWAQRRRRTRQAGERARNRRAAIESTIRSLKHPWANSQLPVRGRFRVTCLLLASAAMCNVRRIHRYLAAKPQPTLATPASRPLAPSVGSLFRRWFLAFIHVLATIPSWRRAPTLGLTG
jgi:hypothetical protein